MRGIRAGQSLLRLGGARDGGRSGRCAYRWNSRLGLRTIEGEDPALETTGRDPVAGHAGAAVMPRTAILRIPVRPVRRRRRGRYALLVVVAVSRDVQGFIRRWPAEQPAD